MTAERIQLDLVEFSVFPGCIAVEFTGAVERLDLLEALPSQRLPSLKAAHFDRRIPEIAVPRSGITGVMAAHAWQINVDVNIGLCLRRIRLQARRPAARADAAKSDLAIMEMHSSGICPLKGLERIFMPRKS